MKCKCGKTNVRARGLCAACYERARRQRLKEAGTPIKRKLKPGQCDDCGAEGTWATGLCAQCYWVDYYHRRVERDGPRQTWPNWTRGRKDKRHKEKPKNEG